MLRRRSRTRNLGGIQATPWGPGGLANGAHDFLVGLPRPNVTSEPSVGMVEPPFSLRLNSVTLTLVQNVTRRLSARRTRRAALATAPCRKRLAQEGMNNDAPIFLRFRMPLSVLRGAAGPRRLRLERPQADSQGRPTLATTWFVGWRPEQVSMVPSAPMWNPLFTRAQRLELTEGLLNKLRS